MVTNRLVVKEAALTGMAFLLQDDPYSHQLSLVGQHLNEAGMRDLHKVLISAFAQVRLLLPVDIFANHQCAYALLNQMFNDAMAVGMQVVVDLASALIGKLFQLLRCAPSGVHPHQFAFQIGLAFVVILVDGLERTPVNQQRRKAWLV